MLKIDTVIYERELPGDLLVFLTEEGLAKVELPSGEIEDLVKAGAPEGKFGEVTSFCFWQQGELRRLFLAGLGKREELDLEKVRRACGKVLKEAGKQKVKELTVAPWTEEVLERGEVARALTEGFLLGSYRFERYLEKKEPATLENVHLACRPEDQNEVGQGLELGKALGAATNVARDLVNEPANYMTPAQLAKEATAAGEKFGFSVEVMEREAIEALGMKAFLEVGRASVNTPRLIVMRHLGDPDNPAEILGLVGKGITFDSGGLSLKSAEGMATMKYDMGGAAAVIGAMSAIARQNLPLNVTAVVAACENLVDGVGYRPGDIIDSMAGKTILISSTDAEGRLTLADAIHYIITKENVKTVVDIATLTGAVMIALGNVAIGVLTNDQGLYGKLQTASEQSGERVWQLPSFPEYREQNKTPFADLKNTGGRGAGTITAGLFVEAFVQEKPWLHLDIAGTAFAQKNLDYLVEGATGRGVRLLYHFAEQYLI